MIKLVAPHLRNNLTNFATVKEGILLGQQIASGDEVLGRSNQNLSIPKQYK